MNLARGLAARGSAGNPVRVGLVGAGKFGTMILAQLRLMPGVRLCVLADLDVERGRAAAVRAGWDADRFTVAPDANAARPTARYPANSLSPIAKPRRAGPTRSIFITTVIDQHKP
ncbi:MAG: hypothetical protein NVS4B5_11360 [Vulcanimicrobiaceae bacterium]